MTQKILFILCWAIFCRPALGESKDSVKGLWEIPRDGTLIEVKIREGKMEAFIFHRPENISNEFDKLNPDPTLRRRPILGLKVLSRLTNYTGGRWVGGIAYDPNSGATYRAQAELKNPDF